MLNVDAKGHGPSYDHTRRQQLRKPGRWRNPEEPGIQRSLGRCLSMTSQSEPAVR